MFHKRENGHVSSTFRNSDKEVLVDHSFSLLKRSIPISEWYRSKVRKLSKSERFFPCAAIVDSVMRLECSVTIDYELNCRNCIIIILV